MELRVKVLRNTGDMSRVTLCLVMLCYVTNGKTPCDIGYDIIESYGVVPFRLTLHILERYCGQFTLYNSNLQPNLTFEIIIRSYR